MTPYEKACKGSAAAEGAIKRDVDPLIGEMEQQSPGPATARALY